LIVVDTSGLLAALDRDSRAHVAAAEALAQELDDAILSPFVLAELDYMIRRHIGSRRVHRTFLEDVADGQYLLAEFGNDDVARALDVLDQYRDLSIGLTDASLVVLAERYDCERVLTLDERDFRAMRSHRGRAFELLPADLPRKRRKR
jgi:uncharacterized protein